MPKIRHALPILLVVVATSGLYVVGIRSVWVDEGENGIGRAAALAAVMQAPLLVLSVGIAAWQVIQAAQARKDQANEAQELERQRSRPYVTVSLDIERDWPSIYLDIANLGVTAAYDVRVEVDPPFDTSLVSADEDCEKCKVPFVGRTIPSLVPGQKLTTVVEHGTMRQEREKASGLSFETRFTVTVRYRGRDAVSGPYEDKFFLDFELLLASMRTRRNGMHELVNAVKSLSIDKLESSVTRQ